MKYHLISILLITIFSQSGYATDADRSHLNIDDAGLAIQGYDPISYHTGTVAKGLSQYSFTHGGALYLFSSQENLEKFTKQPTRFLPAYGGWCAWAMLDGEKVSIDPKTYKIIDGTTYLYYNYFFINTLSKWNRLSEKEGEKQLTKRGLDSWERIIE